MRLFLTGALMGAFFMLAAPAFSGERQTTLRAGDMIFYGAGCHALADMEAVVTADDPGAAWRDRLADERCFVVGVMTPAGLLRRPIPARLVEWMSGPWRPGGQGDAPGSIWRIHDAQGDTEFVFLPDDGGGHAAAREMRL